MHMVGILGIRDKTLERRTLKVKASKDDEWKGCGEGDLNKIIYKPLLPSASLLPQVRTARRLRVPLSTVLLVTAAGHWTLRFRLIKH